MEIERLTLVYDADCRFCVQSLNLVKRVDVRQTCRFESSRDPGVSRRFPQLADVDLNEAMYAIDARGKIYKGFFAFRKIVASLPVAWPVVPLFYFPGSAFIGQRVYAWIARHRNRLGCRATSCSVSRINPL